MKTTVREPTTGFEFVQGVREVDGAFDAGCSCRFISLGWPTRELAEKRIAEHQWEHSSVETLTSELIDFKIAAGYDVGIAPPLRRTAFIEDEVED